MPIIIDLKKPNFRYWRIECDLCKSWHSNWNYFEDAIRLAENDGWHLLNQGKIIICPSCAKKHTFAEIMTKTKV